MPDDHAAPRSGLLQSALDEFLGRAHALADAVGSIGGEAVGAVPGLLPDTVAKMLLSLQQLVDQVPQLTTEVDVLLEGVHAKRLTLQALQAELAAFDSQLQLLEQSLAPLQAWTDQWSRLRGSLSDTLGSVRPTEPTEPTDG
ncbi:MAG: hypothetical protein ABI249_01490 [Ornithinibacter sp.]